MTVSRYYSTIYEHIIIAYELGYLDSIKKNKFIEEMDILGKQIRTLISKLIPKP